MISIRTGTPQDTSLVTGILRDAAEWLILNDKKLWPPEMFTESSVADAINNHLLVIAEDSSQPAGIMFLQTVDHEFWPEKTDKAYYLHRLCVPRPFAKKGIPSVLIEWAYQYAVKKNMHFLRLDCAPRDALMNVYQQTGFVEIDRVKVGEMKTVDGTIIPGFVTVRFERKVCQY
jgi:GNAT superfamily N-acetyltransferase